MCDISYTFMNKKVVRNKFTSLQGLLGRYETLEYMKKDQSIIDNLNKYEFEEVVEDFIEIDGDFTPGSAPSIQDMRYKSCEEIVSVLMNQRCAWSVIYFNSQLGKVFVGRDVFGRQSLVFSSDSSSITISRIGRPTTLEKKASSRMTTSFANILTLNKHVEYRLNGMNYRMPKCSSSIRFMGSGADEIFAGYSRHRQRYERDGNSRGIAEECEMELRRLGMRNGGRDSRVALVLGVEINRAPFLHDDLVEWANGICIEDKADLSLPRGVGEKKMIREVSGSLLKLSD
uniref:Uncharacterized protein n=1 Tax=Pristionchus pacificus TaxID=54126 RepID=A0A2A6BY99_PRIPA|eukprot:PDM70885.1 hypothetical protein PRIPAC_44281 [Pristionchus pacificus]